MVFTKEKWFLQQCCKQTQIAQYLQSLQFDGFLSKTNVLKLFIADRSEPNWKLNAVVSTLSTGPVGPSDMVGATNVFVLMKYVCFIIL